MKRLILIGFSVFAVAFLVVFNGYGIEQQTVRIVVEQSYKEDRDDSELESINDPVPEGLVRAFLEYAGLEVISEDLPNSDVTLEIQAKGVAVGAFYGDNEYHYTGARVSGTIRLEMPGGRVYEKEFQGYDEPSPFVLENSVHSPERAFSWVWDYTGSFSHKVAELIAEVYGADVLDSALELGPYSRVYRAAEKALGTITSVSFQGKTLTTLGAIKSDSRRALQNGG